MKPATVDPTTRAMIDAYIAAGRHQRLPTTDARILPSKLSLDWASMDPATASERDVRRAANAARESAPKPTSRSADGWPEGSLLVSHVGPCAAVPGSKRHTRYQLWRLDESVEDHKVRGVRLSDLRRDQAAGRIVLTSTDGVAEPAPEPGPEDAE